jgi:plastocyanin
LGGSIAGVSLGLAVLLSGCGGSSKTNTESSTPAVAPATSATTTPAQTTTSSGTSAATKISLEADPTGNLKYTASSVTAKAGTVEIAFTNKSPVEHNVSVESSSGQQLGATPTFTGGSKTLTLNNLKPGTYTFFCSVPGHRAAGMHGTLVVQ